MSDPQPDTRALSGRLFEQTERRTHSIYSYFSPLNASRDLREVFADPKLPLSLKCSAVLATFANFKFPLQFSAFRSPIPRSAWNEHFRVRLRRVTAGVVPTFWNQQEWFYTLSVGPKSQSRYGSSHIIYFVANSAVFEQQDEDGFAPPLDSPVVRFTLCHPFLQPELHDPSGIYLFTKF